MAISDRRAAPRPVGTPQRSAGGKAEIAPALFRLLSDSALYRAAMSASRVPLALLDAGLAELPFVFVNRAFERISGYAARDTLARPASLALATSGDEAPLGRLLALTDPAAASAGFQIACRVRRRDATERAVRASFDPVRDDRGRITHWIVALDDAAAAEFSRPPT